MTWGVAENHRPPLGARTFVLGPAAPHGAISASPLHNHI
jgi:hypothetical protein